MRIAISGTANTGKSTLVKNIQAVWASYKTTSKTYRDLIKEKNLPHSSATSIDTQWDVLNFMIDQLQETNKNSNIIFDRCPLDNLAYTLWAHDHEVEGFTKEYVDKAIRLTRESMRHLDIIFLLKYDPSIKIVDDSLRDTDETYIKEIDEIFDALYIQYRQNYDADIFFPKDDSPGIIVLPTNPQKRIDMISDYLTPTGELYGDEHSIFNSENLSELETLVKQQKAALEAEEKEKELFKKFSIPVKQSARPLF
jgi:predicted ATPase